MSELGILRCKSKERNSLYMSIGGEGVETEIRDRILYIRAENRMLGYLNAADPFDKDGWYCTNDIVDELDGEYIRITGRNTEVINIGGQKFLPLEIERVCMEISSIKQAKAIGRPNPITGQHVELYLELDDNEQKDKIIAMVKDMLKKKLPRHMVPSRVAIQKIGISHRFKRI